MVKESKADSTTGEAKNNYLSLSRHFSDIGNVYDTVEWETSDIGITDEKGSLLFTQDGVEFPNNWSPLARKIIASRYFYGERRTPKRENSLRQLIGRVSETFSKWAIERGYFSERNARTFGDEIVGLSLSQMMAFNSPVWFNVGVDRYIAGDKRRDKKEAYIIKGGRITSLPLGGEYVYPQTSACFIQSVDDTMESIMQLAVNESMLFKHGSGTGTDLSTLRSSREKLSGGGKPSGPLAYLTFYDRVAGIVKSGGKTRRAAKMNSLRVDHPDILEFIIAKMLEQKKLEVLMDYGRLDYQEASSTVFFQNANLAVRATDDFMRAAINDKEWHTIPVHSKELAEEMPRYKAKFLLKTIAETVHNCGDPGMQFHDTVNRWHTCPNSKPINASNPCSEYMFIDNSSCNLASLNLMKFVNRDGTFNIEDFKNAVRVTAIAQDLEIDNSSYPTKEIARNSHKFRPLGMGYANLGSLLMFLGLPYDSNEARATAATLTALMTGKVYETSIEMARKIGTFKEFEKNKEPMLEVIKMHQSALKTIDRTKLPEGLESVLDEAEQVWTRVVANSKKYGFRNAQATVLAPTGTIGIMMDCDTKGIEPEIGLVQQKLLAEGGVLKLVNSTVKPALERLGYNKDQITSILKYVEEHQTIEGSELKEEHLPIFDCSNKPPKGKRTISPEGHIKMMAAVQPFLSGAISKTVNLPKETTPAQIEQIYINSWKQGLKAVTLYRDGCKRAQPLSFRGGLESKLAPQRKKLPITRQSMTTKFDIAGHEGYATVGLFPEGWPGELFLIMSKEGSTIRGLMDTVGLLFSFCLQYGVPLEAIVGKLKNQKFDPSGLVHEGHPKIKTATSIPDYVAKFLEEEFLKKEGRTDTNEVEIGEGQSRDGSSKNNPKNIVEETVGFCPVCGREMIKKGGCNARCIDSECGYIDYGGCGS